MKTSNYILNTNTNMLHKYDCSFTKRLKNKNKVGFFTIDEAIEFCDNEIHYCSFCKPDEENK